MKDNHSEPNIVASPISDSCFHNGSRSSSGNAVAVVVIVAIVVAVAAIVVVSSPDPWHWQRPQVPGCKHSSVKTGEAFLFFLKKIDAWKIRGIVGRRVSPCMSVIKMAFKILHIKHLIFFKKSRPLSGHPSSSILALTLESSFG